MKPWDALDPQAVGTGLASLRQLAGILSLVHVGASSVHGRQIISMDVPLDRTLNVIVGSPSGSIFFDMLSFLNLSSKVFWWIHSVEYIRAHPTEERESSGDHGVGGMRSTFVSWIEETTLRQVEMDSPQGLTSQEILGLFEKFGVSLSEATLRKYVQLGLLPRSVRVGEKGKHRGSKGVYPVRVVRQILLIKKMMAQSFTIEQIQKQFLFLRGELEEVEESLSGIFEKLGSRVAERELLLGRGITRELNAAKGAGRDLMVRLRTLESRLAAENQGHEVSRLSAVVGVVS